MKQEFPTHHRPSRIYSSGIACILALMACPAFAFSSEQHLVDMDHVHWSIHSDPFHCKLELPMKRIGRVSFYHAAGSVLEARYTPLSYAPEQAHMAVVTPPWFPGGRSQSEPMEAMGGHYRLSESNSRSLFHSMDQGFWTILEIDNKEVLIPTIHWDHAAETFRACQKQLMPMSIYQARDQEFFYDIGQRALNENQLNKIATLGEYLIRDENVTRILIDSYTDNTGSRGANLQISRERAADVAAELISAGVPSHLIEQRAHGNRYPSADNSTPEGRNLSRKVTVRVIRKNSKER